MTQFKIALARCLRLPLLMLPVFSTLALSNFMRAEEPAAPSTISTIHFRSPGGSSIVVPVYINDSGPFDFLLDTGSTITFIDPELLRSLKLNVVEDGTVTALTGKTPIPLGIAQTVSVGPLTQSKVEVGARDLAGLHEIDSKIRGVLGQNVLSKADYLIDYRKRTIEFDFGGSLAAVLDGERVNTIRIETPDNPNYWNTEVPVTLAGSTPHTINLVLDTGSASVVLFSDSLDLAPLSKRASLSTLMKDDAGNRRSVTEYPTQLHVGGISMDVEARVVTAGFKGLAVNGLLSTAGFGSVYISNSDGFVIFQPKLKRNQTCDWSIANAKPKDASGHVCQHVEHEAGANGS